MPKKNIVIVTAKGGNTSIENKNLIPICGVPMVAYPLRSAKLAPRSQAVFVTTEDDAIKHVARQEGAAIIDRPTELSRPESQHKDVIRHAVEEVWKLHPEAENFIVLLGNTVMTPPWLIDLGFRILEEGKADSCMSVWRAQDDHPFRALKLNEQGYAESFLNASTNTNRQSYPTIFFYDQGIWAFKGQCAIEQKGPAPWVWLGQKCKLIERLWVTGRDVHSWIDVSASAWFLNDIQVHEYTDWKLLP
jgi:CMP-N-acetylneuraminic acid synthetase